MATRILNEQIVARFAAALDLFTILAQSEGPLRTKDVSSKSGGDPLLIGSEYRASQHNLILTSARSHLETSCFDVYTVYDSEQIFLFIPLPKFYI